MQPEAQKFFRPYMIFFKLFMSNDIEIAQRAIVLDIQFRYRLTVFETDSLFRPSVRPELRDQAASVPPGASHTARPGATPCTYPAAHAAPAQSKGVLVTTGDSVIDFTRTKSTQYSLIREII